MKIRLGLRVLGPLYDNHSPNSLPRVTLASPTWGPANLLRDLELRLGLPPTLEPDSARLQAWAARIKSLDDETAFYRASFLIDELGTAEALIEWRDALVDAGWDGRSVLDGGPRLAALAAIEATPSDGIPLGTPDRLVRIWRALERTPEGTYDTIVLLDARELWSSRWRQIFARLEASGTSITTFVPDFEGASATTDLGMLQARLRNLPVEGKVRGDGSVLLVEGETSAEVAEITAAMLARGRAAKSVDLVVRCSDLEALEIALAQHGVPGQGASSESLWRPAMQILPLAIELTFEPKDPLRALELLTLPVGPFRGVFGARLAKAIAREPGIGGREWEIQKAKAADVRRDAERQRALDDGVSRDEAARRADANVAELLGRVATWFEEEGAEPPRAPRAKLVATVERVLEWLRKRMNDETREVYGGAHAQAREFSSALARDPRESFTLEETRHLLDRFAREGIATATFVERAGRVAHVRHPSAILSTANRVFVWNFVSGVEHRPARLPWNPEELRALSRADVEFVEPFALLRNEADQWRRTVLAARSGVVFVRPRSNKGVATAPHSLWDEVHVRLGLDDRSIARIRCDARGILEGTERQLVRVAPRVRSRLPEPRGAWTFPSPSERGSNDRTTTASALETFVLCPLRWVFEHRANLHSGAMTTVASDRLLYGKLTHRLVEQLHRDRSFELSEEALLEQVSERIETLIRQEGAVLLRPGASTERDRFERRASNAVRALHRYLRASGQSMDGVEEVVGVESVMGRLEGRLDVRLRNREGRAAVLDLKWGKSSYRTALQKGRAIQLAVYARALASGEAREGLAPAGYFSLSSGVVLSTDARVESEECLEGPPLADTWKRVERTALKVRESLERGTVYVSGTRRALPLLEALGIAGEDRLPFFEGERDGACRYCDYDALCGKRWEAFG